SSRSRHTMSIRDLSSDVCSSDLLLARESRYLSAKEVQEILQETFPSISQDTIYRNLNLFSELDILETTELNGEKLYQFSCMSKRSEERRVGKECFFMCTTSHYPY